MQVHCTLGYYHCIMTAHYIAQIVEKKMQELDLGSPDFLQKSMADYNRACGLLGIACGCSFLSHQYRFIEFEQLNLCISTGQSIAKKEIISRTGTEPMDSVIVQKN